MFQDLKKIQELENKGSISQSLFNDLNIIDQIENGNRPPLTQSMMNDIINIEQLEKAQKLSQNMLNAIQEDAYEETTVFYLGGGFFKKSNVNQYDFFYNFVKNFELSSAVGSLIDKNNAPFKLKPENIYSFALSNDGYLYLTQEDNLFIFKSDFESKNFVFVNSSATILGKINSATLELLEIEKVKILLVIGGENDKREYISLIHYFDVSVPKEILFKGFTVMNKARKRPIVFRDDFNLFFFGGGKNPLDKNEVACISFRDIVGFFQMDSIATTYFEIKLMNSHITKESLNSAGVVEFDKKLYIVGREKNKLLIIHEINWREKKIKINYAKEKKSLKTSKKIVLCNSSLHSWEGRIEVPSPEEAGLKIIN